MIVALCEIFGSVFRLGVRMPIRHPTVEVTVSDSRDRSISEMKRNASASDITEAFSNDPIVVFEFVH